MEKRTQEYSARSFAKLMWEDKINAALKMLSQDYENGVLQLDEMALKDLKVNHPSPSEVKKDSLLHGSTNKMLDC